MKKLLLILLLASPFVHAQIITTIAGDSILGYNGDNILATAAELHWAAGVAVDAAGNVYITDAQNQRVRKVNTAGIITTIAGNGATGFSGDGGPADSAELNEPSGIVVDVIGNIYFTSNDRIRKIDTFGIVTTIAGNGITGYNGDGITATSAELYQPAGMALDRSGNLYFADVQNDRVRKISASGIITTIAGGSTPGNSGDGGLATNALVYGPHGVAIDAVGNIYIADYGNSRVRVIDTSGIITAFAGTGAYGYSGDGGAAASAQLYAPTCLALDNYGDLYIGDSYNANVRMVNSSGIISTIAGNGTWSYSGDGGPADSAGLDEPMGICVDHSGNVYVADFTESRIRRIGGWPARVNQLSAYAQIITIYPNPATTILTISATDKITNITICNLLGQIMVSNQYNEENVQVDVADLPGGIYFVRVNGVAVRKFLKE